MSDRIYINGLELYAYHGATEEEQTLGHRYICSLELEVDLSQASQSDSLGDTVNYGEIAVVIEEVVRSEQNRLLEKLSKQIVDKLFLRFPTLSSVRVKLGKRFPPMPFIVEEAGVEIYRTRFTR